MSNIFKHVCFVPGKAEVLFERAQHVLIEDEDLLIIASEDLKSYRQELFSLNLR
jgi:hypothetical protein